MTDSFQVVLESHIDLDAKDRIMQAILIFKGVRHIRTKDFLSEAEANVIKQELKEKIIKALE